MEQAWDAAPLSLCDRLKFPETAHSAFLDSQERLNEASLDGALQALADDCMNSPEGDISLYQARITALAAQAGIPSDTMSFLFLLCCVPTVQARYREKNLPEDIFWASMDDLRCKLGESLACFGIPGTSVARWYTRFFNLTRFALGRFQYETRPLIDPDVTAPCGLTVKTGETVIGVHIPSSGQPLTDALRQDSYRRAWAFYKDQFSGAPVVLRCASWLLYPAHRDFLPETSNLLRFMDDFYIYKSVDEPAEKNAWRIFGADAQKPTAEWPEDSGLRRAYKKRVLSGLPVGKGTGILVLMDGKNVTFEKNLFK